MGIRWNPFFILVLLGLAWLACEGDPSVHLSDKPVLCTKDDDCQAPAKCIRSLCISPTTTSETGEGSEFTPEPGDSKDLVQESQPEAEVVQENTSTEPGSQGETVGESSEMVVDTPNQEQVESTGTEVSIESQPELAPEESIVNEPSEVADTPDAAERMPEPDSWESSKESTISEHTTEKMPVEKVPEKPQSVCGNNTCESGEDCSNCAKDCGCASGKYCTANKTCQTCPKGCCPKCTNLECGTNSCGGSCGSCKYGCDKGLCGRQFRVEDIVLPCNVCADKSIGDLKKPDPYIRLTLSNGFKLYSGIAKYNKCNTVKFNWQLLLPVKAVDLRKAKIEIVDDELIKDEVCASWSGDFSKVGTFKLQDTKKKVTLTYKVTK